ncbi:MAG: hypothetical protein ABI959_04825 [Candidatus Dormiibacterota bacterium]
MNKRPGQITVTVESGFCSFCDRTRNLRQEERQLGALVRTVTSCESCHRVLSSTIGVANPDAALEMEPAGADSKPQAPAAPAPRNREAAPKATGTPRPEATAAKTKTRAKGTRTGK